MNTLEDRGLEKARSRIGALVILTQDSKPKNYQEFIKSHTMNGVVDLVKEGYVIGQFKKDYALTEQGLTYAKEILSDINDLFKRE